jgi:hypothetical protein
MIFINPKTDLAFKKIFGSEQCDRSFSAQGDRLHRELLMNNDCLAAKFYQTTFLEEFS